MKLTESQKKILEDITNEFNSLNESEKTNESFSLIDMSNIISKAKQIEIEYEEIQLNNNAMNKIGMEMLLSIVKKLDNDFRKAGVNLKCDYDKDRKYANQIPIDIIPFNPYTGEFIEVDSSDKLYINLNNIYDRKYFHNHGWVHKIIGFSFGFGAIRIEKPTIEELLTSAYFTERLEKLYTKYCNI